MTHATQSASNARYVDRSRIQEYATAALLLLRRSGRVQDHGGGEPRGGGGTTRLLHELRREAPAPVCRRQPGRVRGRGEARRRAGSSFGAVGWRGADAVAGRVRWGPVVWWDRAGYSHAHQGGAQAVAQASWRIVAVSSGGCRKKLLVRKCVF